MSHPGCPNVGNRPVSCACRERKILAALPQVRAAAIPRGQSWCSRMSESDHSESDTEEPSRVTAHGPAAVIVLAAGEGTRMRTATPKMLNEVCGRPMLGHVLTAARELEPRQLILVVASLDGQVAGYA